MKGHDFPAPVAHYSHCSALWNANINTSNKGESHFLSSCPIIFHFTSINIDRESSQLSQSFQSTLDPPDLNRVYTFQPCRQPLIPAMAVFSSQAFFFPFISGTSSLHSASAFSPTPQQKGLYVTCSFQGQSEREHKDESLIVHR